MSPGNTLFHITLRTMALGFFVHSTFSNSGIGAAHLKSGMWAMGAGGSSVKQGLSMGQPELHDSLSAELKVDLNLALS